MATTVVIFPTLWSGPWIWREQANVLASFADRQVWLDGAVANWPGEASLVGLDAYVGERIRALEPPLLLVGCSLGGLLALRLACARPDLVATVVASGCPGLGPSGGLGVKPSMPPTLEEARRIRAHIFTDPSCLDDESLADAVAQVSHRSAVRRAVRLLRELDRHDAGPALERLRRPAALIWGAHDRLTPPLRWRALAQAHPCARFIEIPAAGHVPMLDAPAAYAGALRTVLRNLGASLSAAIGPPAAR